MQMGYTILCGTNNSEKNFVQSRECLLQQVKVIKENDVITPFIHNILNKFGGERKKIEFH